ncbi:hypothetical protein MLD38_024493 [Melastoma candidum]|uniref:Uncharacterized protein n=1 Tax=Melastoma candidum TaxID=119954 RepID=A0ACB9NSG9_9MYRT|nr:hypothetical protein MLD38_024493 [Melastoma candidum]
MAEMAQFAGKCWTVTKLSVMMKFRDSVLSRRSAHRHSWMGAKLLTVFLVIYEKNVKVVTRVVCTVDSVSAFLPLRFFTSFTSPSSFSEAVSSSLSQSPSNFRSSLASFPHSPVDEHIRSHFESSIKSDPHPTAVYLYFLDLGPQSRPYAYNYAPGNPDPFSPAVTKCLGTIWTGHDRYAWIDLGAGPVDYGPAVSGDGVLPRGDFHPLATLHGKTRSGKGMIADVASITWSAYQVLVTPSLRVPVPFENSLIVQFVYVVSGDGKTGNFDWRNVERSFMDEVNSNGLLLSGQSLRFTYYPVKYSECAICSYAVARATNSYTSRFLFDNYTLTVSEYLDSKLLHQVILDSTDEFRKSAGIPEDDDFPRLLPVYIFDLEVPGMFLLDRYHQAVSFKDMVVAVRTKNSQTVSEYSSLSRYDFEMAFYYLRSSDHDLYGMHAIVYRASLELEASLVCFQEPPFPWFPVTMSLAAVGSLLYVWSKRNRLFRSKRKQF